ncbi:induced myeloid leukemia cell differentiation protein Mcl-1b [Chaetodon trifascialis]|uniref:induced myeloid leukemia cell differentiation protein Mcl-1b n=1 Tax=Chaetodon trifascialis TaxID=109706 RepID=UPI0039920E61
MNIIPTKRPALDVTTGVMSFLLQQNGGMDGSMHYGSGDSSRQITVGASLDSHNGNVGSSDTPKRPKVLGVSATKGYTSKNLRDNSSDMDEGSLPCTPELQSDSEIDLSSCPGYEVLENDTRQLMRRFFRDFTGLSKSRWNESKALSTMKRVVDGVLEKHRYAYNGMINKLSLDDRRTDDVSFVSDVARSLFADGSTNWGRIASLVAFGAVVAQHLKEKGRENCVEQVGQEISSYLLADQREWLMKNNSWDGFVEFFRVADPESTVRNTLMAFAGFAGIGATLALLIR